jgi:uncharacterized protein YlxW (UPF0749 family)
MQSSHEDLVDSHAQLQKSSAELARRPKDLNDLVARTQDTSLVGRNIRLVEPLIKLIILIAVIEICGWFGATPAVCC